MAIGRGKKRYMVSLQEEDVEKYLEETGMSLSEAFEQMIAGPPLVAVTPTEIPKTAFEVKKVIEKALVGRPVEAVKQKKASGCVDATGREYTGETLRTNGTMKYEYKDSKGRLFWTPTPPSK